MDQVLKEKVWQILEDNLLKGFQNETTIRLRKTEYMRDWPRCKEYRVAGLLGAGGKVWFSDTREEYNIFVTTDFEELTDERRKLINKVNKELNEAVTRDDIDDIIDFMFGG